QLVYKPLRHTLLHVRRVLLKVDECTVRTFSSALSIDRPDQLLVKSRISFRNRYVCKRFVNNRGRASVLDGSGPYDILHRSGSSVHIEFVVGQYLFNEHIVVRLLDVFVLAFLKCVRVVRGDPFPARSEFGSARGEVLEVRKPWKTFLLDEACGNAL